MKNKTVKYNPFVSIICVTFNRRPFMETFFQCIRNQDYPKSRFEIIIVDDGSDKIKDLVLKADIPQLKYFPLDEKMSLGKKRNYSHTLIDKRTKYITYFDDDDYHHPERISHAVDMLEKNPTALCGGTSELYVFFKHISKLYQFGPYGPKHATAGTMTFRRELLEKTNFDDNACLAEERFFLKDYSIPFVQLNPLKTILVISHDHNTFDKRKLLLNLHPKYAHESKKTVDNFINKKNEAKIRNFFFKEIDDLLKEYDFGESKHKPDVLKQTEEIELARAKVNNNVKNDKNTSQIMIEKPGEAPTYLNHEEVVKLLIQQQDELKFFKKHVQELEEKCQSLQNNLLSFVQELKENLDHEKN